ETTGPSSPIDVAAHVPAAPGVEGVVDEAGPLQQAVVVAFDVEATHPDGEQPGSEHVGVEVLVDVGGVDDASQPQERGVGTEAELVDEHLEAAPPVSMGELGPRGVEGPAALPLGGGQYLGSGDVADLGLRVDEPADEPRTG